MTRLFRHILGYWGLLSLSLILCIITGGCQMLGLVMYKTAGDPDVPAQYTLVQKQTLVLVENYRYARAAAEDAELLGRLIHARLSRKNLVPLVGHEKLLELKATQSQNFNRMTIVDIAHQLGAEQVIYVHFQGGGVTSMGGGSVRQGQASVLVRVVDAQTGQTVWPTGIEDGRVVSTETDPAAIGSKPESDIRLHLYDDLAMKIVRLFHSWKPDSSDMTD